MTDRTAWMILNSGNLLVGRSAKDEEIAVNLARKHAGQSIEDTGFES